MTGNGSSRRSFFKLLAAAPLLSQIAARDLYANAAKAVGSGKSNVYTRLGLKTIINCRGTWTYLSGSLEFPEVRQAQLEASEYFVNMAELQFAGRRRQCHHRQNSHDLCQRSWRQARAGSQNIQRPQSADAAG